MKQIGEYIITHPNISKGAFASIHKGEHKYTHKTVAIKEIKVNNTNNLKNYVVRELEIHKKLNHPNIVKIYDIIISNSDSAVYMIMEFCEYGDLQKYQNKNPLNEKYIQNYMIQLRDALKYLHDNNIVHRDLKPQNILLTDPLTIKITDFGLARNINTNSQINTIGIDNQTEYIDTPAEQDLFSTFCGSPIYMSPELLNKQQYSSKSDLWSVGIILYELITGTPPYIASNLRQLIKKVNYEPVNLDKIDRTHISADCFDLLSKLLKNNKHSRMEWDTFFNHKWFNVNMVVKDENLLIENPLDYNLLQNIIPTARERTYSLPNKQTIQTIQTTQTTQTTQSTHKPPQLPDQLIPPIQPTHTNTNTNTNTNTQLPITSQFPAPTAQLNTSGSSHSSTEKLKFSNTLKINRAPSIENMPSITNSLEIEFMNNDANNDANNDSANNKTEIFSSSFPKNKINSSMNSPMINRSRTKSLLTKQFTFSLKSSQFIDEFSPKSQISDINLSDLEQDDLYGNTNVNVKYSRDNNTREPSVITNTKPINIINNNNNYNYHYNRSREISSSSSSLSNTPNQCISPHNTRHNSIQNNDISSNPNANANANQPNNKIKKTNEQSPSSIEQALKFIKETYDYLSNDNKSL
jgi:serine/threonine protein kinase